jgi:hypothetical protein
MMNGRQTSIVWVIGLVALVMLGLFAAGSSAQSNDELASSSSTLDSTLVPDDDLIPYIYLPLVTRSDKPPTTLPFHDGFELGVSPDWVPFENYPGLEKEDWRWYGVVPDWGYYAYEPERWDGYALSMYMGPGSALWTDYQVVTLMKDRKEKVAGLWIRGSYENTGDMQGGKVSGYYVQIKPGKNDVFLQRLSPATGIYYQPTTVASAEYTKGIGIRRWYNLKVQVQGANIKVWLKEQNEPESAYVLLINWTDPDETYMQGTVGFIAFRTVALYNDITVTPLP